MRIYKYMLPIGGIQEIEMPIGAKALTAQEQHGAIFLWALIDDGVGIEKRKFAVYLTGKDIEEIPGEYISTVQLQGGRFVFHIFELKDIK